jgi:hypothetical protein
MQSSKTIVQTKQGEGLPNLVSNVAKVQREGTAFGGLVSYMATIADDNDEICETLVQSEREIKPMNTAARAAITQSLNDELKLAHLAGNKIMADLEVYKAKAHDAEVPIGEDVFTRAREEAKKINTSGARAALIQSYANTYFPKKR